jgi:hypothetical protein
MLSGTTGIADVFVMLLVQMLWAIAEIAACLLLLVLASRFILRTVRDQLRHEHGAFMPAWYERALHGHDPRPWLRRRSRRVVRRITVTGVRRIRWLDHAVRG